MSEITYSEQTLQHAKEQAMKLVRARINRADVFIIVEPNIAHDTQKVVDNC